VLTSGICVDVTQNPGPGLHVDSKPLAICLRGPLARNMLDFSGRFLISGVNVSSPSLSLEFHSQAGVVATQVTVAHLVIAGWTGRDRAAVEKHIRELEELGVQRPATTPVFYRASASLLTTDQAVEIPGEASSGEVEFVLLQTGGKLWVGVGSDHTDRQVETYNVTVSKQMCAKPIGAKFWAFDEVVGHWDSLLLRSSIEEGGASVPYQEGGVTAMLDPRELIALYTGGGPLAEDTLMFCGTLAARGGIRPAPRFSFEIEDPVRGVKIAQTYAIATLPVAG
jgi:hypothetical protein